MFRMIAKKLIDGQVVPMRPQVNIVAHWLGRILVWLLGWTIQCVPFPSDKFVLVGAPHTSNMDFLFLIATSWVLRLKLHWIGKHTLFRAPIGWISKRLGGIPVDRRASFGAVDQIANQFKTTEEFIVVIAPSGTRKHTDHWKSGFYWIASKAEVPIVCAALDYSKKLVDVGMSLWPSDDVHTDMNVIRTFYKGVQGRFPQKQTTIRLREELPK
jgi:1-acyl-sn-glycerol-3-phosphate acyltransferase